MEIALMTEPQLGGTHADLTAAALWAEARGLVAFARSDHWDWQRDGDPNASDALVSLGGLARETTSIRLTSLVSPLTFRHPAVLAKSAATLDEMSGGRFDLGVGTGWMELEHTVFGVPFPPQAERFARLADALPYLHQALRHERAHHDGQYYSIDGVQRPLAPGVNFIVGGSGPRRTPRLAARWADEYNTFLGPVGDLAPRLQVLREEAERLERDPCSILCSVMGPALVGADHADYRELLAEEAESRDKEPAEVESLFRERGIPVGTIDEASEQVSALEEIGVGRWYVQVIPHDLDTIKRRVTPLLAR